MLNFMVAVLLAAAGVAAAAGTASAGGPIETVEAAAKEVFNSQSAPGVKTLSTAERRADVRKVIENLFDFADMSERSLGPAWTQATPAQQKEFVRLFGALIANAYMSRIEQYKNEPITYVSEKIEGDEASVQSRVLTSKGSDIGLDYKLYRADGRWHVYDIFVDGFSIVGSYKAQFHRIIQRGSFAELLKTLREKTGS